jgi:hypothetical protein
MKRLVISAAMVGSAFIFTSCATDNADNNDATMASNTPQESPYAPPINSPIFEDLGFNRWPQTFRYEYKPGEIAGQ